MRVNARLDEAARQQIEFLTQASGQGVSHVVREAVAHYYAHVRAQQGGPRRFLSLAGKGDSGRSDIASNAKAFVADALADKHRRAGTPARTGPNDRR